MENKRSRQEVARDVELTRQEAKRAFRNAGDVWSGKNAIAAAWRSTRRKYYNAQDKIADTVYTTDNTVRQNLYSSIGIALGIGAVFGYFLTRRPQSRRKRKC
jgi:ElaB/YqjD/DUF883 family membrane-anchored ribosome-binding protein